MSFAGFSALLPVVSSRSRSKANTPQSKYGSGGMSV